MKLDFITGFVGGQLCLNTMLKLLVSTVTGNNILGNFLPLRHILAVKSTHSCMLRNNLSWWVGPSQTQIQILITKAVFLCTPACRLSWNWQTKLHYRMWSGEFRQTRCGCTPGTKYISSALFQVWTQLFWRSFPTLVILWFYDLWAPAPKRRPQSHMGNTTLI